MSIAASRLIVEKLMRRPGVVSEKYMTLHYRGDTVTWPVASTLSVWGFGREVK
jgi:hypothetical protein